MTIKKLNALPGAPRVLPPPAPDETPSERSIATARRAARTAVCRAVPGATCSSPRS